MTKFTASDIAENIEETLYQSYDLIKSILSYSDAGLMTNDEGLVLNLSNGQKFQITIKEV